MIEGDKFQELLPFAVYILEKIADLLQRLSLISNHNIPLKWINVSNQLSRVIKMQTFMGIEGDTYVVHSIFLYTFLWELYLCVGGPTVVHEQLLYSAAFQRTSVIGTPTLAPSLECSRLSDVIGKRSNNWACSTYWWMTVDETRYPSLKANCLRKKTFYCFFILLVG